MDRDHNAVVELAIQELGPKGDGVHQSERGRIYVDRALPGDTVRVDVRRGAGGVLRGDLLEVMNASPCRKVAPCPHYDVCGSCTLQHASEEFYREWKTGIVRDALRKRDLNPEIWRDPVFLPAGSRRRVTFVAGKRNNVVTLGYFRRRSHQVADIASCLIADPAIMALRARLVPALAAILREGKDADIFIQVVDGQCEVVITGPIGISGRPDLPVYETFGRIANSLQIGRMCWRARDRDEPEVMIEINPLRARFGALDAVLPPLAFLQPTKAGEDVLVGAVMDMLPKTGRFADLFSGCGTFSGSMLERGTVDAYEIEGSAIRALDKAKGAKPLRALQRDLFRGPLQADEANRYDAIVFDPPRAGAQAQVMALAASRVRRLIAVSCDPVTFARDARVLVDGGYRLESIKVVDQFIWSHHVELAAAFTR